MPICPQCLSRFPDGDEVCPHDGAALAPDAAYAYVDRDLAPGDVVGEYRIEGKLGEGGFGAVYAAVHPVIGKRAAVKVLSRTFSANPGMVSRFIAEARAVNQIRHRNIIDIFSFGQLPDGRQYYVMELLDGVTFDKHLAAHGRLSFASALPILRGIARALDAAHAKGILHRDLKPENVFLVVDEDGHASPKLLDFGLVKLVGSPSAQHKTKTGTPMGTPYYMSPEQCRGDEVDARTDVYAFGVVAFQVLTGKMPFDGEGALKILLEHMEKAPPAASSVTPEVPVAFDAPLARALAKEPADRPATVGQALELLVRAAEGAGLEAAPSSPVVVGPNVDAATREAAASARTVAAVGSGQTFLGSESDVMVAPPRGRMRLLVGFVAVLGLAAAGALAFGSRTAASREPSLGASATSSAAATGSAVVASASSPVSAPSPPPPEKVTLRIEGAPAGATVSSGGKLLGTAPGPFEVTRGERLELVVAARGYKSRPIEVSPAGDLAVTVALEKRPNKPPTPGRTISKDLEDF